MKGRLLENVIDLLKYDLVDYYGNNSAYDSSIMTH